MIEIVALAGILILVLVKKSAVPASTPDSAAPGTFKSSAGSNAFPASNEIAGGGLSQAEGDYLYSAALAKNVLTNPVAAIKQIASNPTQAAAVAARTSLAAISGGLSYFAPQIIPTVEKVGSAISTATSDAINAVADIFGNKPSDPRYSPALTVIMTEFYGEKGGNAPLPSETAWQYINPDVPYLGLKSIQVQNAGVVYRSLTRDGQAKIIADPNVAWLMSVPSMQAPPPPPPVPILNPI